MKNDKSRSLHDISHCWEDETMLYATKKVKSLLLFSTQFLERVHIMENNITLLFFFEGTMLVSIFRAVEKSMSIFAYLRYSLYLNTNTRWSFRGEGGKIKRGSRGVIGDN